MKQCSYLNNGCCLKASKPIKINPQFCAKCLSTGTKLIDPIVFRINGTDLGKQFGHVGTELRKLIEWFPIPKKRQGKPCQKCRSLEAKFNLWGPDLCEQRIDRIVKRLRIAARRRKLPVNNRLLYTLVRKAIANARASS